LRARSFKFPQHTQLKKWGPGDQESEFLAAHVPFSSVGVVVKLKCFATFIWKILQLLGILLIYTVPFNTLIVYFSIVEFT